MFTKKLVFVEHSYGSFVPAGQKDGVEYDNVILSDGYLTQKFQNETGQEKLNFEKGDEVECDFEIEFMRVPSEGKLGKGIVRLHLVAIR